ncbi:sterol 14-demethylase [Rhizophagus irregularis DAOM 197198w]|uniref:Sterol 14-demethylase n=3 Tax=Rhizophagus irregularis TaxID=588596 RepID=A0A015K2M6_RHIIW|nr:sterol 14-demethylase [Rhizophagus irregularis DAOM 197198w]
MRPIVLCRGEYLNDFLSKNTHEIRFRNCKGAEELGFAGKGLMLNSDYKSWTFNHHLFNQAILSPKFTDEAIDHTNKLFNELEIYWSKRSYSMAAYFDTLSNEKSDHQSARVINSVKLFQALRKLSYKANDVLQGMEFINQKLNAIIKSRRQEIEEKPLDEHLPHDMLTSMIIKNTLRDDNYIETGEATRPMTDTEIRVNILDGIFTGTYKIGNMLSFIVYYIAHNPDVKKKMLKEIDSIFQDDKMRPITKDDFYSLSYCEAIVKEVARIHPVIHLLTRYIDKPNKVAEYHWPADSLFLINVKSVHNNDDYWEEPNKFNPDRWIVKNFEPKKGSFLMFGGGLRLCPGRKLATIELVCLIALLFRKYEIDLVDMNTPIKTTNSGTMVLCVDLLVEIKPRN